MQAHSTDQELIERIRRGDRQALEIVYKANRLMVQRFVLQNQGTEQDAEDLYQETILAFYRNVTAGSLTILTGKLSTYLYKIAQNQWRSQLRIRKGIELIEAVDTTFVEDPPISVQEDAFLQRMLDRLDERCRRILQLFYFDQLSMQQVAEQVGLTDGESAKKRKFDCLAKLKKLAKHDREYDTE